MDDHPSMICVRTTSQPTIAPTPLRQRSRVGSTAEVDHRLDPVAETEWVRLGSPRDERPRAVLLENVLTEDFETGFADGFRWRGADGLTEFLEARSVVTCRSCCGGIHSRQG
jgi:hypothetical protein